MGSLIFESIWIHSSTRILHSLSSSKMHCTSFDCHHNRLHDVLMLKEDNKQALEGATYEVIIKDIRCSRRLSWWSWSFLERAVCSHSLLPSISDTPDYNATQNSCSQCLVFNYHSPESTWDAMTAIMASSLKTLVTWKKTNGFVHISLFNVMQFCASRHWWWSS